MFKFLVGFSAGFGSAVFVSLAIVRLGSGNQTAIKPSPSPSVAVASVEQPTIPKKVYKFRTLEITIVGAGLSPQGIAVQMEVKNLSPNEVYFHPDLGSAVIGDRQFNASISKTVGDEFGTIQPGVTKKSTIYFVAPEGQPITSTHDVQKIKLLLEEAKDYELGINEPIEIELNRIK